VIRTLLLAGAILVLLSSPFRFAASAGQVFGTVRTLQGAPLAGARLTVVNSDVSAFFERRSDVNGAFSFSSIPPGTWTIGASAIDRAYRHTLRSVGAPGLQQDFQLGLDIHPGRWSVIGNTSPENLYASNSGSLLPDGTILYCHDTEEPVLFDPVPGAKSFPASSPSLQGCHAATLLLDGRLIFVGGQDSGDFRDAVRTVKTYNYQNGGWLVLPELQEERWYPGLVRLADGRLLAMGGGQRPNARRTPTCEIFDPATSMWTPVESMSNSSDYPPAVLLYNGEVLRTSWSPQLYNVETDAWRDTGPMVQPERFWPGHCDHSLVLLPDGRACAVGIFRGSLTSPRMIELYYPVADAWRRCADMARFREYHALSLLVPDGRVVVKRPRPLSAVNAKPA